MRQAELSFELQRFWPSGGPSWDALAIVYTGGPPGVLLVEAKAHPAEMASSCGAKDQISKQKINAALNATKFWLGVDKRSDWFSPYYQSANRLAHLYFLREIAKVPAWLANIYFVDDASHISTPRVEWDKKIAEVEECLGLRRPSSPYVGNVFLSSKEIAPLDKNVSGTFPCCPFSLSALANCLGSIGGRSGPKLRAELDRLIAERTSAAAAN